MKVMETRYKGCRFRSRLEARWAVFFDALGVRWGDDPFTVIARLKAISRSPASSGEPVDTIYSSTCVCSWWADTGMSRDRCAMHYSVPMMCPVDVERLRGAVVPNGKER